MKENNADWCEKNCPYFPDCGGGICNFALGLLKEKPDVVRCKDCKHYDYDTQSCNDGLDGIFLPDWFCADGERR